MIVAGQDLARPDLTGHGIGANPSFLKVEIVHTFAYGNFARQT